MRSKVKTGKANAAASAAVREGKKITSVMGSKKAKAMEKKLEGMSKVVYIGHLAHGFYEKEMRKFFSQFGRVVRLKLFRSKNTGNSKGYAFVEFEDKETAGVVGEALDGYYLNERRLVSHVVPSEKIHTGMFKTKRPKEDAAEGDAEAAGEDNGAEKEGAGSETSGKMVQVQARKYLRSQQKKALRLKELGIDFL